MENHHAFRIGSHIARDLKRACRCFVAVNLGIAFISQNAEIVFFGQRDQAFPVVTAGNSALRVGGRTDVGQRRAIQNLGRQAFVIRQMSGFGGGGYKDSLGPDGRCGNRIDLIERVRCQNDRLFAALCFGAQRHGRVVQPFARAVQRHDICFGIDSDAIAPLDPVADRGAQFICSVVRGVAAEFGNRLRKNITHPVREGMFGFTNGHMLNRATRRMGVQ